MAIQGLDANSLERRLCDLLGDERNVQADFLLHFAEFARRKGYEKLGHKNLWNYCRKKLGLAEATTFRRIHAAVLLRKYPIVEAYLRDGRLCMTRLVKLEKILTPVNARQLFDRASGASKREIEELVAELAPRPIPKPLLRKLPARPLPSTKVANPIAEIARQKSGFTSEKTPDAAQDTTGCSDVPARFLDFGTSRTGVSDAMSGAAKDGSVADSDRSGAASPPPQESFQEAPASERAGISEVVPLSAQTWLLRIGVGKEFVDDLERGLELYSHVLSANDYATFIAIAVHEFVERLAKRKGAMPVRAKKGVVPGEPVAVADEAASAEAAASTPAGSGTAAVPAVVTLPEDVVRVSGFCEVAKTSTRRITMATKRFVWERDGGCCVWPLAGGGVCGSRRRVQFDHILAEARGGSALPENIRLLCAEHNAQHAREDFGSGFIEAKTRTARADAERRRAEQGLIATAQDVGGDSTVREAEVLYGLRTATMTSPPEAEVPYGTRGLPPVEVFCEW